MAIPRAIKDAGFTSPEISFTAQGELQKSGDSLVLKIAGLRHEFALEGGNAFERLKLETASIGKAVRVSGKLALSEKKRPPAMSVESYELASRGP